MTITSAGYDGTVDEVQWASMVPSAGSSEYGVYGSADWKITAHPTTDKAVLVAPGKGWGQGVFDTSDASEVVQCDALASGTRWDVITAHRDWQPVGGTTTFSKVTGGATKALPAGRLNQPGVQDDQPLALVQWTAGQTQPTAIVDLRCWAGNGGLVAVDKLALTYLQRLGAQVKVQNGMLYLCEQDASGNLIWNGYQLGAAKGYARPSAYIEPANSGTRSPNTFTLSTISIPDPGYPYHVQVNATVEAGGGGSGTRWDVIASLSGAGWLDASRGDAVAPWWKINGNSFGTPKTGPSTVDLVAIRQFGNGNFGVSGYNQFFSVLVIPAAS